MRDVYPKSLSSRYSDYTNANSLREVQFNVEYLHELELIKKPHAGHYATTLMVSESPPPDGDAYITGFITARGIDFLEDDGGLTAILGVVTVKLHSETLSALEGKILASDEIPTEEKTRLLDRLRSLPEEGAKALVHEMVKVGLSRGPEVWETALRYLSG